MLLTDGNGSKKECTKVKPCCRASEENKYIDFTTSVFASIQSCRRYVGMFLSSKPIQSKPSTYATQCIATGYYRIYLNSEPSERVSRSKLSDLFIPIVLGLRGGRFPIPNLHQWCEILGPFP